MLWRWEKPVSEKYGDESKYGSGDKVGRDPENALLPGSLHLLIGKRPGIEFIFDLRHFCFIIKAPKLAFYRVKARNEGNNLSML